MSIHRNYSNGDEHICLNVDLKKGSRVLQSHAAADEIPIKIIRYCDLDIWFFLKPFCCLSLQKGEITQFPEMFPGRRQNDCSSGALTPWKDLRQGGASG